MRTEKFARCEKNIVFAVDRVVLVLSHVHMILKRFSPARFSSAITLFIFLAASLIGSSTLRAGASNKSGNPFGNGTFFPDSGNYSGIVRGTNGFLGVVQFATSATSTSTNTLTNSGIATIYAQGEQFTGAAFGSQSGSTISATYQGVFNYNVLVPTANLNSNGQIQSTTYSSQAVTDYVNGQFTANLYNTYPTQSFSGGGQAAVIQSTLNPTNFVLSSSEVQYSNTVSGSSLVQ